MTEDIYYKKVFDYNIALENLLTDLLSYGMVWSLH